MRVLQIFLFSAICTQVIAADWPFYRGPNRNGVADVKFEPVEDEPERLWKVEIGDIGHHGCPVIVDGKVYIVGGYRGADFYLHCLDAETGEEIWKAKTGGGHGTPAVADGKVYTIGNNRIARCNDAETGEQIWETQQLPAPDGNQSVSGSPLIWEDLVIFNFADGCALNRETGEVVWLHSGLHGLATPVLFKHEGKPAVAIFVSDRVVARDPRSGEEIWSIPWPTDPGNNACDPVFIENDTKVFLCTRYGMGRALWDVSGGEPKQLWFHEQGAHTYASGLWLDGSLYAFADKLVRLDLESGELIWDKWKSPRADSVLVLGDKFVLVTEQGEMIVGEPTAAAFVEEFRAQIHRPQSRNVPAYWEGKLYVRNHEGEVICVRISK